MTKKAKKKNDDALTTAALVEIVTRVGRHMSSPDVGKIYKEETGNDLHPSNVYRLLEKAIPSGRVQQSELRGRVRWLATQARQAGPALSDAPNAAPNAPSFPKDKARMAASMYAKVAEILNSDSPDVADAMSYKRSADLLMAVV